MTLSLRTERMTLRSANDTDAAALAQILADPEAAHFGADFAERATAPLLVVEFEDRIVGALRLHEVDEAAHRHAALDLVVLLPSHRNRGLAREALARVLTYLASEKKHHRVVANVSPENERAYRALHAVGFRRVGRMRACARSADGQLHDRVLMEWIAPPPRRRSTVSSSNFQTRLATSADLETILTMMDDFNEHEEIPMRREDLRGPLTRLMADPELGRVYVFTTDRVVGYSVTTFGFDLEFGGRDAFITEIYLSPSSRGDGLGARALDAVVRATKEAGAGAVHLQVRSENVAARELYLRHGFEEPDRLLMTKRL